MLRPSEWPVRASCDSPECVTRRGGKPAGSNFADHAAHLAEVVLLGNIAIRMNQKLEWDTANMKFPNCPEADKFVNPPYRDGFAL